MNLNGVIFPLPFSMSGSFLFFFAQFSKLNHLRLFVMFTTWFHLCSFFLLSHSSWCSSAFIPSSLTSFICARVSPRLSKHHLRPRDCLLIFSPLTFPLLHFLRLHLFALVTRTINWAALESPLQIKTSNFVAHNDQIRALTYRLQKCFHSYVGWSVQQAMCLGLRYTTSRFIPWPLLPSLVSAVTHCCVLSNEAEKSEALETHQTEAAGVILSLAPAADRQWIMGTGIPTNTKPARKEGRISSYRGSLCLICLLLLSLLFHPDSFLSI